MVWRRRVRRKPASAGCGDLTSQNGPSSKQNATARLNVASKSSITAPQSTIIPQPPAVPRGPRCAFCIRLDSLPRVNALPRTVGWPGINVVLSPDCVAVYSIPKPETWMKAPSVTWKICTPPAPQRRMRPASMPRRGTDSGKQIVLACDPPWSVRMRHECSLLLCTVSWPYFHRAGPKKETLSGPYAHWGKRALLPLRSAFRSGTGRCVRYRSWTSTSVPGLAPVLYIRPSPSSCIEGDAQSKSHSASSSVMFMQPRLMGVPKLLCQ